MKEVGKKEDIVITQLDDGSLQMDIWDDDPEEAVVYRHFKNKEEMVEKFTKLFDEL